MPSMAGNNGAILAFDAHKTTLALATGDGRVRLFDAAQQRLLADITPALTGSAGVPSGADVSTCLSWGPSAPEAERLLYLGTRGGKIQCFDVARGELRWTGSSCVDGPVAAIGPATGGLLVAGRTGGAAILDLSSGNSLARWQASKHNTLSTAALLPDGAGALLAGASVALHDVVSGTKLHRWTGHATPAVALTLLGETHACSAAQGERTAAVWSLNLTPSGKLRYKSAVAQLNLDEEVAPGGLSAAVAGPGRFHVAAVTVGGALRLFEFSQEEEDDEGEGGKAKGTAHQWGASYGPGRVLKAEIAGADATGVNLVLVCGSTAAPVFLKQRVNKVAGGSEARVQVPEGDARLIGKAPGGADWSSAKKQGSTHANSPAAVIGAEQDVVLAGKRSRDTLTARDDHGEEDLSMENTEDDDLDVEGPTFAERIAKLREINIGSESVAAGSGEATEPIAGPLKADSLAVLLTQALQSNDKVLLERCLAVRSEDVISKTVRRLSPADAASFLRMAVERLQSSPARGDALVTWIRAVLLQHTAHLSGVASTAGTLSWLYQIIEARLANYQSLLALQGRLDLVLANAKRSASAGEGDDDVAGGPLATFEVADDGDVMEVEDAFGGFAIESDEFDEEEGEEESEEDFSEDGFDEDEEDDDGDDG